MTPDTIPGDPALDEHPDQGRRVCPNANLTFVADAPGVIPLLCAERAQPWVIWGVMRSDSPANPEYELPVESGGSWVMFAPFMLSLRPRLYRTQCLPRPRNKYCAEPTTTHLGTDRDDRLHPYPH